MSSDPTLRRPTRLRRLLRIYEEQEYAPMGEEDYLLGGPKKSLSFGKWLRINGYIPKKRTK